MKTRIIILLSLLLATTAEAKVRLPHLFQDGMVLQRNADIAIWGWADSGESIHVSLSEVKGAKAKVVGSATTQGDANGRWLLRLPWSKKMKAGGPYLLQANDVQLSDVLLGDVWLCSGQSNVDVTIERVYPQYVSEIDSYENPLIRLFRVQNETDTHAPKDDIRPTSINWKPVTKQNAWPFSALGYFLGKRMYEKSNVPQGIIVNSWGGTPIEAWVSADSLRSDYPMLVEKTRLYDNPDFVRAQQQANQLADRRWNELLDERDPGLKKAGGEYQYTSLSYDDSDWRTIRQYEWGWRGVGTTWLRQHVTIDREHARKAARLLLGTLFDADITYVNGRQVGRTYYQYPPRRYDIPEGLLREGDNVIAVRFINKYGTVHFIPEKQYLLAFGDDRQSLNPLPKDIIRLSETWKQHDGAAMPGCPSGDVSLQNLPTTLYNAVLHPLAPYTLAGVVWYQGESNTGNARDYAPMLRKLMGGWRTLFQQPQLPFVIVQLANHQAFVEQPQNSGWAQVREAQRTVARDDNYAESVVNIDLGETVDIHPLRKKEVAERVGLCMERLVYNNKVELFPQIVSTKVGEGKVTLTLDQPMRPASLKYFELAGSDRRFQNVEATAEGNTVLVKAPMPQPKTLRYAWKDNPLDPNAYSTAGLPLSPFEMKLQE